VIDWAELDRAALAVQRRAHAPYSRYFVGAALQVASGAVFTGCNVENASYGLSICAERSAILQMVAAGEHDPVALVVVTRGPILGTPCGACRQTLAEFARDLPIRLRVEGDAPPPRLTSLEALLPDAFRSATMGGPESPPKPPGDVDGGH
jgi:cytidine deaminase